MADFKMYLEDQFTSDMSWDNHGTVWHIDHILPLAAFELQHSEEIAVACHYTNLQPLLAADNFSKGASIL